MLKLYYNPGSCSLASHAALEEAGLPYTSERVDLPSGMHELPAYRAVNPWGRVPALETDHGVVTETVAILSFIADLAPDRKLLPPAGSFERIRALEWMALLSSTVHISFRPLFRPSRLAATEAGQVDVAAVGIDTLNANLALLDNRLGIGPFALGGQFSVVDLYLFVFLMWMRRPALDGMLVPRANLAAARERLLARPAIRRTLVTEGLLSSD